MIDITILLTGKFESTLMHNALSNLTERWYAEHSLSENLLKTVMVLFIRKRKLGTHTQESLFYSTPS